MTPATYLFFMGLAAVLTAEVSRESRARRLLLAAVGLALMAPLLLCEWFA